MRKCDEATKTRFQVDQQSLERLHQSCQRTISSLERHMKRANRLLRASVTSAEYEAVTERWRGHLRWMRLNLVYFKPVPPRVRSKRRFQMVLDVLTEIAIGGLRNEGYAPPQPEELRRTIRLYVASARRDREFPYTLPQMIGDPENFSNRWHLAQFIMARTKLTRLP